MMSWASSRRTKWCFGWAIAALLLAAFLGQGLAAIKFNSQTFDELAHFAAGYSYWATGDFRLNPEHPPLVKQLCLLPVYPFYDLSFDTESSAWERGDQNAVGLELLYGADETPPGTFDRNGTEAVPYRMADGMLNLSRLPNLVLGALLVALVGWWAYQVWGAGAGLLATVLAALEPTLVAHSSLVTTDVAWTLFATASIYAAWEFCRTNSWQWLVGIGVATGLALASKFSAVSLLGILPVILVGHRLSGGRFEWLGRARRGGMRQAVDTAMQMGLALLVVAYIALIVVWASYFFQDPLLWWDGFRHVLDHQRGGHPAWFWGQHSRDGWPTYFVVALGIKTQVATIVLAGASLLLFAKGKPLGRDGVVFLVVPLTMFLSALFLARINIGVRHALHAYPLLFVLAGRAATIQTKPAWIARCGIGILVALSAFSAWRIAPYPLAYFNEVVGGPVGGRHILTDSNLDWGQGLLALAEYYQDQDLDAIYLSYLGTAPPEYFGMQYQYVPAFGPLSRPEPRRVEMGRRELLAISDLNLKGIWFGDYDLYAWLASRRPIATLAHSIYVYDITNDSEAHFELARVYLKERLPQYAKWELEKVLAIEPGHAEARKLIEGLP